ncbi:MAG: SCO family protein [Candidatus Thiodiazotropha sp.]
MLTPFLILALTLHMFAAASALAGELPSIVKSADDKAEFVPPFKYDCVTKSPSLAERLKVATNSDLHTGHTHDQHAHHKSMMESREYQLKTADYAIPQVTLTSHRGEQQPLGEILDTEKPVMLNFIFTTCTTICPVLSASFHQVQEILGEESDSVSMISITIDPDYDTPEQLMKYSKRFKAGDQWQFFTGSYQDVVSVEKAFDIFRGSKMNHEPITLIRSQKGELWTRINGLASADDIVREYRKIINAEKQ